MTTKPYLMLLDRNECLTCEDAAVYILRVSGRSRGVYCAQCALDKLREFDRQVKVEDEDDE